MPTHTITFNLPDEDVDLMHAMNGSKYASILFDIDQQLRQTVKYQTNLTQSGMASAEECNFADMVRTILREKAEEYGIHWTTIEL